MQIFNGNLFSLMMNQTKNAWCMPGGKIAFYSGILPILKNAKMALASVMGHEIAHAVARHSAERASTAIDNRSWNHGVGTVCVGTKKSHKQLGYVRQFGLRSTI